MNGDDSLPARTGVGLQWMYRECRKVEEDSKILTKEMESRCGAAWITSDVPKVWGYLP